MPDGEDPLVARRYLSSAIRAARGDSQMTQEQVAELLAWSPSKVVRIESGTVSVSVTDLRALMQLFDVTDAKEVAKLVDAARDARRRGWHRHYPKALEPGFDTYLSYEEAATEIRIFEILTIPGLFQTEAYAKAILKANQVADVGERAALRMERQSQLECRQPSPTLICVIDEAALHREVGGPEVMREQLTVLAAKARGGMLSVVPYSAGAYRSMNECFTLLHSHRWDEDVLFREGTRKTVTDHEDHGLIEEYRDRFRLLSDISESGGKAAALIENVNRNFQHTSQAGRPRRPEQPE